MNGRIAFVVLISLWLVISAIGCASTRTVAPSDTVHYDEAYDASDKQVIVRRLVESLKTTATLGDGTGKPVLILYGIANRTDEHISTSGIADDIRKELLKSGRFAFVNRAQRDTIIKEMDYQYRSGQVAPDAMRKVGRQVGAEFMVTGTLRSIEKKEPRQIRLRKRTLKYYSLNLEITNIETGLVEWADSVEIMRESAKPFIGW